MTSPRALRVSLIVIATSGVMAFSGAQAQMPAAVPVPAVVPSPDAAAAEYILGPEDVVEVEVVGTNDRVRGKIYTDGTIQTNLGGRVSASGRTPRELAAEIAKSLKAGGFYADPVVNVEIVGFASRYVTVLGSVGSPGLVPINRAYRLSEIVARVGGIRSEAADYLIIRPENGVEKRYLVDKMAAGDPENDPIIAPGDKIFAPEAPLFYISGQVNSPGAFPIRSGMTVAQAIAKGGGLTESGSDKKVTTRRAGKKVKLSIDAIIEVGDVITVGERLF